MKNFAGHRVLVIDDEPNQAESLALVLETMGCAARFITDPLQARHEIDAHRPELVLIDIQMPYMDGYQLAQEIRRRYGPDTMRIVALTGSPSEKHQVRARVAGFDAHIAKPVGVDMLEAALMLFLS